MKSVREFLLFLINYSARSKNYRAGFIILYSLLDIRYSKKNPAKGGIVDHGCCTAAKDLLLWSSFEFISLSKITVRIGFDRIPVLLILQCDMIRHIIF
jgi:hypothetical protein